MLSSKDVESNTTLLERLNKLNLKGKHSGTTFSREIYNSDLGFTINTDHIKRVEDIELGIVSYNFPLIRDSISTNNLENLLLQTNADGGYDAYIVEYGFTKEQYSSLTEEFLGTTTTKYTPIDFDASVFNENELSRTYYGAQYICVENWVVYWHTSPRDGSQIPEWVLESTSCYWIGGGGDGTDTGSGGSGSPDGDDDGGSGGSSTGGDNDDDDGACRACGDVVVTTPVVEDEIGQGESSCEELKRLGNSAYLSQEFNTLNNTLEGFAETGFGIKMTSNFPYMTPYELENISPDELMAPKHPLAFAAMHNHYIGKYEMFGHGDIYTLFKLSQTFNFALANTIDENGSGVGDPYVFNMSSITLFMTVRDYTYAIKIDNIGKLASIQQYFADKDSEKVFASQLESIYQEINYNPEAAGQTQLAKAFLMFVNETYDFGISLYRATEASIASGASSWEKLSLDPTQPDGIKKTPCN